ncbi:unnamed protein product [Hymenolepis diminuta]|uniref:Zinc finger protein 330 homolog n=1 Tax=Hymenolepis diminuta TaxID=6216 RepID=A0A0R3SI22_HYMDI|nr:unnamed protein product [Hymenolepis diminuta]
MPKKKTGQRKRAEKNKLRQKEIRESRFNIPLADHPCNANMECDKCQRTQKNRAFCYFCGAVQRLPMCAQCGKQKCIPKGDCVVKHGSAHVTGMALVGAICDFCDAWVCHGLSCLQTHACSCPMQDSKCVECHREISEHGGRMFECAFCAKLLCGDDQFEHQASCQRLESENFKCPSCNRIGSNACLRCKTIYCDDHARRKGFKYSPNQPIPCPKCGHPLDQKFCLSISSKFYDYSISRQYAFGRQRREYNEDNVEEDEDDYNENYMDGGYGDYGNYREDCDSDDENREESSSEVDSEERKVIAEMENTVLDDKKQYS